MSLAGCQINLIDVNFYLQKNWKISWQNLIRKGERGSKYPASCRLGLNAVMGRATSTVHSISAQTIKERIEFIKAID